MEVNQLQSIVGLFKNYVSSKGRGSVTVHGNKPSNVCWGRGVHMYGHVIFEPPLSDV